MTIVHGSPVESFDTSLNTKFTHLIRVLSHCAYKVSIFDKTFQCIGFIKTNTDDFIASGSFDCITNTCGCSFVCSIDTYNTFCDVVFCDCLSFCSITFTELCLKKFVICSFECFSESCFTLDSCICGVIDINNTNASVFHTFVFQSFDHFFTSCFTSSMGYTDSSGKNAEHPRFLLCRRNTA